MCSSGQTSGVLFLFYFIATGQTKTFYNLTAKKNKCIVNTLIEVRQRADIYLISGTNIRMHVHPVKFSKAGAAGESAI
jgi:hypothetical protein